MVLGWLVAWPWSPRLGAQHHRVGHAWLRLRVGQPAWWRRTPSMVTAPTRPTSPKPCRAWILKHPKQVNGCFRSQTIFTMLKMTYEATKLSYNTTPPLNPISQNNLLNISMYGYWQTWKFSKFLSWTWFQFGFCRLVEILASNIIFWQQVFHCHLQSLYFKLYLSITRMFCSIFA